MVNKPKILGTAAETAVVAWLRENGHPYAERRSLRGINDQGDVTGIPGVCIEVKVAGRQGLKLGPWLKETERERKNARARFGLLVAKPTGLGPKRTGQWFAAMYHANWHGLVTDGGWPTRIVPDHHVVSGTKVRELPTMLANGWDRNWGPLLVKAVGKGPSPDLWYVVADLEFMNKRLLHAGYGTFTGPEREVLNQDGENLLL